MSLEGGIAVLFLCSGVGSIFGPTSQASLNEDINGSRVAVINESVVVIRVQNELFAPEHGADVPVLAV